MKLYVATFWTGFGWADLHEDPRPFRAASDAAYSALLAEKATTRLRTAYGGTLVPHSGGPARP